MSYGPMPVRMATVVAERHMLSVLWDGECRAGMHAARRFGEPAEPGTLEPPALERGWEGSCERCGAPVPWDDDPSLGGCVQRIWDTDSGDLEPGCMYWQDDWAGHCMARWTNCSGQHLHVVLPNGMHWDIDGRANNCTMPDDTTHRCWVREGEPPAVTAGKAGHTCSAGAGSILAGDYHGFLQHGAFTAG